MAQADLSVAPAADVTAAMADIVLNTRWEDLTPQALQVAKQCLLDWVGVSLAGRDEPLVRILIAELAQDEQPRAATVVGHAERVSILNAALINGAMSHALDFDDVITTVGHPTVPVAPAVFAQAEALGSSGAEALLAYILGVEIECRIGRLMGPSHYAKGWHTTATLGTFGAAAAAGKLLGLNKDQLLNAFGLAGTQAAGLKSVFGTMAKPLHPGKSAQNGLLAARLARRGFTSHPDILGAAQGFADTQSTSIDPQAALAPAANGFHIVEALFKYHAACYLTHETIEAVGALRAAHGLTPDQVADGVIRVSPVHLGVCNIQEPASGLECKFSLRMTAALSLAGEDTFDEALFSDATAAREDLRAMRGRLRVEATQQGPGSTVELTLKSGQQLTQSFNVMAPMRDLDAQQAKLERKYFKLAKPVLGQAAAEAGAMACRTLEDLADVRFLQGLRPSA